MKYNTDYHSSVVGNYRRLYDRLRDYLQMPELTLKDEEIWDLFEEWHGVEMDPDHLDGEERLAIDKLGDDAIVVIQMLEMQRKRPA